MVKKFCRIYNFTVILYKNYKQNDTLKKSFENIADTILFEIHRKNILPLNDLKNKINQYFLGQLPGNANENRMKIQNEIAAVLPALTNKLTLLEISINEFINQLSDY